MTVRHWITAACALALASCDENVARSANPRQIIDMHVHTIPAAWSAESGPINPVTGLPSTATTGEDLLRETLTVMDSLDVELAVLSGPLGSVQKWVDAAPSVFVGAPQLPMTHKGDRTLELEAYLPSPEEIRQLVQSGHVRALGEITNQYAGMIPGDQVLEPYFALAEEFDLPVGIHTGRGTIRILSSEDQKLFRIDYGNPKWVNDVLARHPRLRIYLMHAGHPYLEDTIALMGVYPNVYADLSRINWSIPQPQFHDYLKRLLDAGFESRLMFGSDGVGLPEAIGLAVEGIESA